jgi:hypothetical protein
VPVLRAAPGAAVPAVRRQRPEVPAGRADHPPRRGDGQALEEAIVMPGDVVDLAARRPKHKPSPRTGAELRRYDVKTGNWTPGAPPMRHHYPITALLGCTCGKTIKRQSPEEPWEHVQW